MKYLVPMERSGPGSGQMLQWLGEKLMAWMIRSGATQPF